MGLVLMHEFTRECVAVIYHQLARNLHSRLLGVNQHPESLAKLFQHLWKEIVQEEIRHDLQKIIAIRDVKQTWRSKFKFL